MTRIAILIPTYNGARFIADALGSVGDGSAVDAVYLSDDHSTDDTIAAARAAWHGRYPLHVLAHAANVGECPNVNRAMLALEAEGIEWAVLLHQDDILLGGWLERAREEIALAAPDVALVCCHNAFAQSEGQLLEERSAGLNGSATTRAQSVNHPGGEASVRALRHRWFWSVSGTAVRIAHFRTMGGFHPRLRYAADNDFLVRVFLAGFSVVEVPEIRVLKRGHSAATTSRQARTGADVLGWSYLMHKYLFVATKIDRTREFLHLLRQVARRSLSYLRRGDWRAFAAQSGAAWAVLRSLAALLTGWQALNPAPVRALLAEPLSPLERIQPGVPR